MKRKREKREQSEPISPEQLAHEVLRTLTDEEMEEIRKGK